MMDGKTTITKELSHDEFTELTAFMGGPRSLLISDEAGGRIINSCGSADEKRIVRFKEDIRVLRENGISTFLVVVEIDDDYTYLTGFNQTETRPMPQRFLTELLEAMGSMQPPPQK